MVFASSPTEFSPTTQNELARFMTENANGPRHSVCPVGGRTAFCWGGTTSPDVIVGTSALARVIDYPARDMTITVEAGLRIDELQQKLASEGQQLPIDIAQPERATLGGAMATNTSGPRRFGHGTLRDYVIGFSAVNAGGRLFKAGGRVVKNVAGYDVCKLMVGSRGTLGIVTQMTLKLRPLSESSALLWLSFSSLEQIELALQRLLQSGSRPVAVEVLNAAASGLIATAARCSCHSQAPVLCVGFEGSKREVDWQIDTLRTEMKGLGVQSEECMTDPDARRLWDALTEFPTCADDPLTFQANLLPSRCMEFAARATLFGVAVQVHAGNGIVIGQLPDETATIERAIAILDDLRHLASSGQGNLIVLHCDPEWKREMPMFGHPEPSWTLMQRLKSQLDPHGIFNPGQFVDKPAAS